MKRRTTPVAKYNEQLRFSIYLDSDKYPDIIRNAERDGYLHISHPGKTSWITLQFLNKSQKIEWFEKYYPIKKKLRRRT